jgi:hypothetical protein
VVPEEKEPARRADGGNLRLQDARGALVPLLPRRRHSRRVDVVAEEDDRRAVRSELGRSLRDVGREGGEDGIDELDCALCLRIGRLRIAGITDQEDRARDGARWLLFRGYSHPWRL